MKLRTKIGVILIAFGISSLAQDQVDYPSRAEHKFYKKLHHKKYKPKSEKFVKGLNYAPYYTLKYEYTDNPFKDIWERTDYLNYIDSLENICVENFRKDGLQQKYSECMDSALRISFTERIGNISRYSILRCDSNENRRIVLYTNPKLEEGHEWGYWLSVLEYSSNEEKEFYTGLTANNFVYVKPKPNIELIKNDSLFQVEVALVRKTKPESLPVGAPEYGLVEDNLVLEMNLLKISQDSDRDGLTDITECKYWTNPYKKDTDNDGILDVEDSNPRFKSINNKYTNLYLHLLEESADSIVPFSGKKYRYTAEDSLRLSMDKANLIITKNKYLRHLPESLMRYIFLSPKEYKKYIKKNQTPIEKIRVSPMFPVDNMPNHYKISIDYYTSGNDYLIIEKENYWIVRWIGGYII